MESTRASASSAHLQSRPPSPHTLRTCQSKHTGGGGVGKWRAPALPRVVLFSVCRLFPLKLCRLTIRPRLKCGVSSHLARWSVTHMVQRRRVSEQKDLVCLVLFFTTGVDTEAWHSGSSSGPYSLCATGLSYAICGAFKSLSSHLRLWEG
jgi:hypothetical protein